MTRKEQNKILDAIIEPNVNQYKVDRLNAEISAFSSRDLNKYEYLKRIDLNFKPNALDKDRFEFSPLGRTFNEGLDKTIPNYQEEGVIKLLKEIRDNLAGLPMPPGPPPDSSEKTRKVRSRSKLLQSDSQKFLDQLKLEASQRPRPKIPPVIPIMPTHKTDSDGAIKKIKGQSKKYDIKKQEEDESSKLLKKQKDELNKFYIETKKKDTDLDDLIEKLDEDNKLLEQQNEQNKLLEQQNKQKKLLEQQNDELNKLLEQQKQEEDIPSGLIIKNINSGSPINLRTFAPRRDPFDDLNKNKEKLTPSPSKIPAPIPKSREPQGVAPGEQASIQIMN